MVDINGQDEMSGPRARARVRVRFLRESAWYCGEQFKTQQENALMNVLKKE